MSKIKNQVLADNAFGTLASSLSISDTTLTFTTGHGARFPVVSSPDVMHCCVLNSANVIEEIKITAHTSGSDSATIVRGAGGTSAKAWSAGDRIEARLSNIVLEGITVDQLSVTDPAFGAVGDGSTDDTVAIQAAITAAETTGRSLYFPVGTYLVSDALTFSKGIHVFGEGLLSIIYVSASVGAAVDIIKISPSTATADRNTDFVFKNFTVTAVSGTPARHAISIDIATRAAYRIRFSGLRLNALGGKGIVTLPNASPITDGFFTSTIEDCYITNGIYLDKAGDSVRILNNTLTGANVAVYADLVFVSAGNTPHGLDIIGNNVTNSGGCVHIKNAYGARITRNVFEGSAGNANNALVDIDGTDATEKPDGVAVYRNMFSTPSGVDAVRVNFARMAQISNNLMGEPGGGGFCFKVTANATDTQILYNPTGLDSTLSAQLSDAGTRTEFQRFGIGGRMEVNQDIQFMQQGANLRVVDTASTTIRVVRWENADNTVLVGVIDAAASNGHLRFYTGGAEAARLVPSTKQLLVNSTSPPSTSIGNFNGSIAIKDNDTAPAATVGWAKIYVDTADGDLKIIFGDGTIKTIVVDT